MPSRPSSLRGAALTAALLTALTGCNKNSTAPAVPPGGGGTGSGSSAFVGVLIGPGVEGRLVLTIPTTTLRPQAIATTAALLQVNGSYTPVGGNPIALTGVYDPAADTLNISGSAYTVQGTYASGLLRGVWSRPLTGSGSIVMVLATSSTSARPLAGSFTSTTGPVSGILAFVCQGTDLDGFAYTTGGGETPLHGTLASGGSITMIDPRGPGPFLGTGSLDAYGAASGQYENGSNDKGTWTAQPL